MGTFNFLGLVSSPYKLYIDKTLILYPIPMVVVVFTQSHDFIFSTNSAVI